MICKRWILLLMLVFLASHVFALGISPAVKNIDFAPGQEITIKYSVVDAVDDVIYDILLNGGDLANYSSLSSDTITGSGQFILTIKLPEKIDTPGFHLLSVSVKERPSETSFISTVVEVGSLVKVFVPYPGFYGDISLNIPDGNIDEDIPVELYIINRGDNPLDLTEVYIDFIPSSGGEPVKKLDFTSVSIPVSGDRYFRKYLNTKGVMPGDYIGRAIVKYEDIAREANRSFRVGSLFVNITNFTEKIIGKDIQKFYVTLENKWNSPIYGAYVDVNLSNQLYSNSFRTPSIDLDPWEEKTIESYLDAENLEGEYKLALNATYHGQSTTIAGKLFVGKDYSFLIYSASAFAAIVFFLILYLTLKPYFSKRKR